MTMIHDDDTLLEGEITFVPIDFAYTYDVIVNGETIAHLYHDYENTFRPWTVTVNGREVFRALEYDQSKTWIESSYRYGTLNKSTLPIAS